MGYGFTCFNCKSSIDFETSDGCEAENLAGEKGWYIGHWNGQGEYVCPDCKDTIWEASLLGRRNPQLQEQPHD